MIYLLATDKFTIFCSIIVNYFCYVFHKNNKTSKIPVPIVSIILLNLDIEVTNFKLKLSPNITNLHTTHQVSLNVIKPLS